MYLSAKPLPRNTWVSSIVKRYAIQNMGRFVVITVLGLLVFFFPRMLIPQDQIQTFLFFGLYVAIFLLLFSYASQSICEGLLLISLCRLRGAVERRLKKRTPTKTQLQSRFETIRRNLRDFVDASTAVFPPITEFLFDRLRRAIDTFYYAAGMVVLSEKPDYYSASEQRQAEIEEEISSSIPEDQMLDDLAKEADQSYTDELVGHVRYFDVSELKDFLECLGNRVFRSHTHHPFWVIKYPINLVDLTKFFEHWNEILSQSENGAQFTKEARREIDQFYSELRRREEIASERKWSFAMSLSVGVLLALLGFVLGRL